MDNQQQLCNPACILKAKTTLSSVIKEKLMVNLSFPLASAHRGGGWGVLAFCSCQAELSCSIPR